MSYYRLGMSTQYGSTVKRGANRALEQYRIGASPNRPVLKSGSTGAFVMEVQSKLGIPVDSIFGPQTKSAVTAFQASKGLVADGIVGPKTWAVLETITAPSPAPMVLPDPKPIIKRGSTGAAVIEAQKRLGITVDGIFGPQTDTAVRKFQEDNGLSKDGIIGPQTWKSMEEKALPVSSSPGADAVKENPPVPITAPDTPDIRPGSTALATTGPAASLPKKDAGSILPVAGAVVGGVALLALLSKKRRS